MEDGLKLLVQPHYDYHFQVEIEQRLVGVQDWCEWKYIVQLLVGLGFLIEIQIKQEYQSE